jgi:putative hydrolase of the HAD superfamily
MTGVLTQSSFKNIIFDLGAVIIDISVPKTVEAFAQLLDRDHLWVEEQLKMAGIFRRYETGEWDDEAFRDAIREVLGVPFTDLQIDTAWNALLLQIPPARVELLQWLQLRYRTFVLSNTNPIHIREVNRILHRDTGVPILDVLFEKVYLSYEMKKMKPSPDIYRQLLDDSGLLPEETVFLDDNLDNLAAAQQLGIQTVHIAESVTILDYFSHVRKPD